MNKTMSKPFTLDSTVRLVLKTTIIVFVILLFRYLSPVLLPFFIAWLAAYILHPIVELTQKKLKIKNRTVACVSVLLVFFFLIVSFLYLFIPMLIDELDKLKDFILVYVSDTDLNIHRTDNSWESLFKRFILESHIAELFNEKGLGDIASSAFPFAQKLFSQSVALTGTLIAGFFSILYLFFILKDYTLINKLFLALIPNEYQKMVSGIMQDVEQGMSNYYRGQTVIVLILIFLYSLGFYIIGMPLSLLMGIIIGILNFVPYFQVVGIPACIVLMLVKSAIEGISPLFSLFTLLIVFCIIQGIQDGFLVPKIMGKKMGLNAAVILLSLSIFGMLFGVVGLIIALPITTLLLSYYKRYVLTKVNEHYEQSKENNSTEIIV